jgi:4-amino-4-deoxy-L-arabinose transferase-like glycosyltransferase
MKRIAAELSRWALDPRWRSPRAALAVLVLVTFVSVGARTLYIDRPCKNPCRTAFDHGLIFDELYYVNAARRILGREVPKGEPYADAPARHDPNAEHPPLAKLIMAGGMLAFGDGPLGWRFGSLVFGTLAILALYWLVTGTGGGRWLAVGAAALMAADNLLMVHGRIATLDIYAVAFMLAAAALYVRDKPILAGAVLGIGGTTKVVALYLVFALGLFEAVRWWAGRAGREAAGSLSKSRRARRGSRERLAVCIAAAGIAFVAALFVLDLAAKPYDPNAHRALSSPYGHLRYMGTYALHLRSPGGPQGIASYPWQWLLGKKTIDYYTEVRNTVVNGNVVATHTQIAFRGAINPFILMVAIPALFVSASAARRRRNATDALAVSWFIGTFVPFVLQSAFEERTTYLYYMVIVMPAIYLTAARLFSHERLPRSARAGFALAVLIGVASLYPFRTLTGL